MGDRMKVVVVGVDLQDQHRNRPRRLGAADVLVGSAPVFGGRSRPGKRRGTVESGLHIFFGCYKGATCDRAARRLRLYRNILWKKHSIPGGAPGGKLSEIPASRTCPPLNGIVAFTFGAIC